MKRVNESKKRGEKKQTHTHKPQTRTTDNQFQFCHAIFNAVHL